MEGIRWMKQRRESSGWGWWIKDKVKKVKVELIAKEFGDAVAAPSKTSQNWNIQGELREPRESNLSPASPNPVTSSQLKSELIGLSCINMQEQHMILQGLIRSDQTVQGTVLKVS